MGVSLLKITSVDLVGTVIAKATGYEIDDLKISTVTSAKSVLLLVASMLLTFINLPEAAELVTIAVNDVVATWYADLAVQVVAANILGAAMVTLQRIS
jgi:hypothetical protein